MAHKKTLTERVPVTLTVETIKYLEELVKRGTHGTTVPGVARTLVEEGVRLAIERRFIQLKIIADNVG